MLLADTKEHSLALLGDYIVQPLTYTVLTLVYTGTTVNFTQMIPAQIGVRIM